MTPPSARRPQTTRPTLLAIVGPTAVGKTALAVEVAEQLGDAELLNADSRQVIRGLRVGTCTPTPAELRGIPCHLLDLREPGEPLSVAGWVEPARRVLDDLARRGVLAVVVGGTGLYVRALLDDLALRGGAPDLARRSMLDAQASTAAGLAQLAAELRARDPAGAATVDLRNPRRVVRALELVATHGTLAAARGRGPGRAAVVVGVDASRELHDTLIADRARRLVLGGALLEEVEAALRRGISAQALDACGIGYREALALRAGRLTAEGAVAALVQRTRRYAKAQRTWFRADPRVRWLERGAAPVEALASEVLAALRRGPRPAPVGEQTFAISPPP